jgi:hypothetical protein
VYSRQQIILHKKSCEELGAITCSTCGKTYKSKAKLDLHIKTHVSPKVFNCASCEKVFVTNKLTSHMKTHTKERPYMCEICNKSYKRKYELTGHKKVHTGTKSRVCDICGYATVYKAYLEIHQKSHFSEFRFKCHLCVKVFKQILNFKHISFTWVRNPTSVTYVAKHSYTRPICSHISGQTTLTCRRMQNASSARHVGEASLTKRTSCHISVPTQVKLSSCVMFVENS